MQTIKINYRCHTFEVLYTYHKAYTPKSRDEQPEPESVEIEKMYHKGNDVTEVMAEFADMIEIETLIIEKR